MSKKIREIHKKIKSLPKHKWQAMAVDGLLVCLALVFFAQIAYPTDRMLPFSKIEGVDYSMWKKDAVKKDLMTRYQKTSLSIYFGSADKAYRKPPLSDIGFSLNGDDLISKSDYVWHMKFLPFSVLWGHLLTNQTKITYSEDKNKLNDYIQKELGASCKVDSRNAGLVVDSGKIGLINAQNGGKCELSDVYNVIVGHKIKLSNSNAVRIALEEIPPVITNSVATAYKNELLAKIEKGVSLSVNGAVKTVPQSEIINWMEFSVVDDRLSYSLSSDKATNYLNGNFSDDVSVKAGVTKVATYNFTETSRVAGSDGQAIDIPKTVTNIKSYIDGASSSAEVATKIVSPSVTYSRSYSSTDEGLSALMKQFAESHNGEFSVSMVEIGGNNRRATYNDTKSITPASTYKLFVAYSTLKRIENGSWNWSDQIVNGKDLSTCFDDMIIKSDNDCGAAMLAKVGYTNITNEAKAIGCTGTSFLGSDGIKTTAADLMTLLAQLRTGQILNQQFSRDKLLYAMENNIYRSGIPTGIGGSTVADKVGFMDGLLHDAAIVYSPTGTYVLVIMSYGSNWSTIADLASQIEALRVQ